MQESQTSGGLAHEIQNTKSILGNQSAKLHVYQVYVGLLIVTDDNSVTINEVQKVYHMSLDSSIAKT